MKSSFIDLMKIKLLLFIGFAEEQVSAALEEQHVSAEDCDESWDFYFHMGNLWSNYEKCFLLIELINLHTNINISIRTVF